MGKYISLRAIEGPEYHIIIQFLLECKKKGGGQILHNNEIVQLRDFTVKYKVAVTFLFYCFTLRQLVASVLFTSSSYQTYN